MRRLLLATCLAFLSLAGSGLFDSPTTVEAAASPRAGRLGGSLEQFEKVHGKPDSVSAEQAVYERLDVVHNKVTLDLYKGKIYRLTVSGLGQTISAKKFSQIFDNLAPSDGECNKQAIFSDFGALTIPCHSADLERGFTTETMNLLGSLGERGDYYWTTGGDSDGRTVTLGLGHNRYYTPADYLAKIRAEFNTVNQSLTDLVTMFQNPTLSGAELRSFTQGKANTWINAYAIAENRFVPAGYEALNGDYLNWLSILSDAGTGLDTAILHQNPDLLTLATARALQAYDLAPSFEAELEAYGI